VDIITPVASDVPQHHVIPMEADSPLQKWDDFEIEGEEEEEEEEDKEPPFPFSGEVMGGRCPGVRSHTNTKIRHMLVTCVVRVAEELSAGIYNGTDRLRARLLQPHQEPMVILVTVSTRRDLRKICIQKGTPTPLNKALGVVCSVTSLGFDGAIQLVAPSPENRLLYQEWLAFRTSAWSNFSDRIVPIVVSCSEIHPDAGGTAWTFFRYLDRICHTKKEEEEEEEEEKEEKAASPGNALLKWMLCGRSAIGFRPSLAGIGWPTSLWDRLREELYLDMQWMEDTDDRVESWLYWEIGEPNNHRAVPHKSTCSAIKVDHERPSIISSHDVPCNFASHPDGVTPNAAVHDLTWFNTTSRSDAWKRVPRKYNDCELYMHVRRDFHSRNPETFCW
jgi:hypothetical protein